jgi:hypothetical protein
MTVVKRDCDVFCVEIHFSYDMIDYFIIPVVSHLSFVCVEKCLIYYCVRAVISSAKKSKGFRAVMYQLAQDCHGLYFHEGKDLTIFYDGASLDLIVQLLFKTERDAEDFQNALVNYGVKHSHFGEKRKIDDIVERIEFNGPVQRVLCTDYDPQYNADSPDMSLQEAQTDIATEVDIDDDISRKLKTLENESRLARIGSSWYKCHLISKRDENEKLRNDVDNFLYESWDFHQILDGLNRKTGIGVGIRFNGVIGEERVETKPNAFEVRHKISVIVEFRDEELASWFEKYLKDGTKRLDNCKFESFLYAVSVENMKYCLDKKYEQFEGP